MKDTIIKMDTIKIQSSERSPEIDFDFATNTFAIRGESYPEDVNEFYGPLMERLESHFQNMKEATVSFTFELIYFNSSTAKILMSMFDMFDETAEAGNSINVIWCFEEDDENMQELGEEYGEDLRHASFELREIAVS